MSVGWAATALVAASLAAPASAQAAETFITSAPPAATNVPNATFTFSGDDQARSFECRLDGGAFAPCTSPRSYEALAEGAHTFAVRGIGSAGPDPTPASHSWTVDFTAPDTALDAAPPPHSNSAASSFAFSSPDATAAFECSLNGAAYSPCTSPLTYSGLSDATRSFSVRAVDAAGNVDTSPPGATWTVDTTAPETEITAGPPPASNEVSPSLEFHASEPGTLECAVNGGAFTPCSSPVVLQGLADGSITFAVRAVDTAGNVDPTPAQRAWERDTEAPAPPRLWIGARPSGRKPGTRPKSGRPGRKLRTHSTFQTTTVLRAEWAPGGPDTRTYDIERATGSPARQLYDYDPWRTASRRGSGNLFLGYGKKLCLVATGTDDLGNTSDETRRCTTVPHRATSLWYYAQPVTHRARGYFGGRYVTFGNHPEKVARLNAAHPEKPWSEQVVHASVIKRVVLVASRCPTCGKVRVAFALKPHSNSDSDIRHREVVDLRADELTKRAVIPVHVFQGSGLQGVPFVFVRRIDGTPRLQGIGVSRE